MPAVPPASPLPRHRSTVGVADTSPRGEQTTTRAEEGGRTASRRSSRSSAAPEHTGLSGRLIAGVPARIMRPRIVFIVCLVALVSFGLLMVYSASAVESLKENGDALHFFSNQLKFAGIGTTVLVCIAVRAVSWERATTIYANALWVVLLLLLIAVLFVGSGAGGAKRWIGNNSVSLQPSEFFKPVIIVCMARVLSEYYERRTLDLFGFMRITAIGVIVPLIFIVLEPDTGTTLIIALTLVAMMYLAGLSNRVLIGIGMVIGALFAILLVAAPYRMARFTVAADPWQDMYNTGYQATLALMAFTSGGLFGRGIGNSTMKYSYLPEAHNDFILAIIGEELGFVGTALFFLVFATLVVAGFKIAWNAPNLRDRMIASGSSFLLGLQFLVNALGILGITPMTGKTMPFISYGGSSMISCLILAGLIIRVSVESNVRTVHDARRENFAVMDDQDYVSDHLGRSTAGAVRVRGGGASPERSGFSVMDGGSSPARKGRSVPLSRGAARSRRSDDARGGWDRIDLNADPADRLRTGGPQTRRRDSTSGRTRYDR